MFKKLIFLVASVSIFIACQSQVKNSDRNPAQTPTGNGEVGSVEEIDPMEVLKACQEAMRSEKSSYTQACVRYAREFKNTPEEIRTCREANQAFTPVLECLEFIKDLNKEDINVCIKMGGGPSARLGCLRNSIPNKSEAEVAKNGYQAANPVANTRANISIPSGSCGSREFTVQKKVKLYTTTTNYVPAGACKLLGSTSELDPLLCKNQSQKAGYDCTAYGSWKVQGTGLFNSFYSESGYDCYGCVK